MAYIQNEILFSHKIIKIGSFVETWMDLETVLQSEVSQKEKNKCHILMHIYGIQKNGTDEPICRGIIETQIQRMNLWTHWGKKRVGQTEKAALTYVYYNV